MSAMTAATDVAPSSEQLFTRGGPNVPDNRGLSMVAKHLEKQQKDKEARAMERLHLLLPTLGTAVRALALQQCGWDEERALTMLRRFQVAKTEELSKLHKERRKHQLALQSGKPERSRKKKEEKDKKKKRRQEEAEAESGSSSDSGSDSSSSSDSSSGSESEGERRKSGSGKRRRASRSASPDRGSKRSKKSSRDKKRSSSGKDKKKGKKEKKEKRAKEKRSSKDKAAAEAAMRGPIGHEYGKYGLIRETDMYSKRPEFQLWAMEVKKIDIEAMPRSEEKEMFKEFMEEFNTATLPHRKYYDLDVYEKQQAAKAAKRGGPEKPKERTAFTDEQERKRELAAERQREQAEKMKRAYDDLLANRGKAQDMREQQLLRSQMELAYKTGDQAKARKLAALLEPVDIADIGKNKRPPAQGT